jgi:hypothetical protein
MTTKYAMMVTIKEARKIYIARARKYREKMGFLPIQKTEPKLPKERIKAIRDAVTLSSLMNEDITVC